MFKFIKKIMDDAAYAKMKKENDDDRFQRSYIVMNIGYYFLSKQDKNLDNFERVKKATEEIDTIKFHQINYDEKNGIINVVVERPGILIGAKGSTINELTKFLSDGLKKDVKIRIKEEVLLPYLYSFQQIIGEDY